jgi:Carboxypeptidase regulatory-like domain
LLLLYVILISALLPVQSATATGRIEGIVCEVDSCAPVKGARVTIEPLGPTGTTQMVRADDSGIFQFSGVPAGRYELQVEAAGFRSVAALPIVTVADGTRAQDVKLFMHGLGSISGRAVDPVGKPLPFAHVEALVYQSANYFELGSFRTIAAADSDSRGGFSLSNLGSDQYLIRIRTTSRLAGDPYPPTYFPGTTDPDKAEKIRLGAGANIDGIELKLSTRGVHLAGSFVTEGGKAAPAMAYLVRRTAAVPIVDSNFSSDSMAEQFDIGTVPPGSYWLYAVTDLDTTKKTTSNNNHSPQWVRIPIEIGEQDLSGILVSIQPAGSLHVHVRFSDDSTNRETTTFSANAFNLWSKERPPVSWNPSAEDIGPNQFDYVHFSEITCFFGFLSDELFISKLTLEGHDITSMGFSSAPGEERLLEVIVSNAGGAITGRIRDVDGKPVTDSRVVLLASPELRANPAFGKLAVTSDTGEFRMQAIAPGEYTIMAFSAEEQSTSRENYERFERFGQHVHIAANAELKVDLVTIPTDSRPD